MGFLTLRFQGWIAALSGTLLFSISSLADAVVSECSEAALRAALAGGGTVTFACDGTIVLTSTLGIASNTTLDANGHEVTISGGHSVPLLNVGPGVSLTLENLILANGFAAGPGGGPGADGAEGNGG